MKPADKLKMKAAGLIFRGKALINKIKEKPMTNQTIAEPGKIYSFEMKTIDGKTVGLSSYKGKVLLIVNVASECGFTPQYEGLEALYREYKDKGLCILAFPANEFGAQEPGSDAQIKAFCSKNYGVSFDLFSKIVVKGAGIHPFYKFLTTETGFNGEIPWNFAKFVFDRNGKPVARFGPETEPNSKPLQRAIETSL